MGRIFETRKATMFARWDKMAKAFTRVGKEIAIAVKAGGPNPDGNPALRRVMQNAVAAVRPANNRLLQGNTGSRMPPTTDIRAARTSRSIQFETESRTRAS